MSGDLRLASLPPLLYEPLIRRAAGLGHPSSRSSSSRNSAVGALPITTTAPGVRLSRTPMEVGPLARVLALYATGHAQTKELVDLTLCDLDRPMADGLFPAADYGHGREYWRAYGLILAWPLNVYNWQTEAPRRHSPSGGSLGTLRSRLPPTSLYGMGRSRWAKPISASALRLARLTSARPSLSASCSAKAISSRSQ